MVPRLNNDTMVQRVKTTQWYKDWKMTLIVLRLRGDKTVLRLKNDKMVPRLKNDTMVHMVKTTE